MFSFSTSKNINDNIKNNRGKAYARSSKAAVFHTDGQKPNKNSVMIAYSYPLNLSPRYAIKKIDKPTGIILISNSQLSPKEKVYTINWPLQKTKEVIPHQTLSSGSEPLLFLHSKMLFDLTHHTKKSVRQPLRSSI